MHKIMLEKKHNAPLILALYMTFSIPEETWIQSFIASVTNFELAAMMTNRQLASLSNLTNDDATEQQDIESSNHAFEYVNPY